MHAFEVVDIIMVHLIIITGLIFFVMSEIVQMVEEKSSRTRGSEAKTRTGNGSQVPTILPMFNNQSTLQRKIATLDDEVPEHAKQCVLGSARQALL